MLIRGGCHCGNIAYTLDWPGAPERIPARACTCSFCTRHGGVWTAEPSASLTLQVRDPALVSHYAFETRTAEFHVCARCGVVTVAISRIAGRDHAVVNVNTFEGIDPALLQHAPATFDGEGEEQRLARRARNWIGRVTCG
jgi:hypothetical protein